MDEQAQEVSGSAPRPSRVVRRSGWGLLDGEIALPDGWDSRETNEAIARDFEV